jgi:hypothetical protein
MELERPARERPEDELDSKQLMIKLEEIQSMIGSQNFKEDNADGLETPENSRQVRRPLHSLRKRSQS